MLNSNNDLKSRDDRRAKTLLMRESRMNGSDFGNYDVVHDDGETADF